MCSSNSNTIDTNQTLEEIQMLTRSLKSAIAATALVVAVPICALAAPVSDVQDYSNNTASEYFVINDANKYNSPYYRDQDQDWGWKHGSIAGATFSSIKLEISAFDVDFSSGELDRIQVFDVLGWLTLGNLAGGNDIWAFTNFDLTGYSWAASQVNSGLQVRMDIDTRNDGWLVTLGKSVLSVDGGNQACVPTPGVPCTNSVPEPGSLALLGVAIGGLALSKRRKSRS